MRGQRGHKEEGQKKGRTSEIATHRVRRKGDHKTCTGVKQAKGEGAPSR